MMICVFIFETVNQWSQTFCLITRKTYKLHKPTLLPFSFNSRLGICTEMIGNIIINITIKIEAGVFGLMICTCRLGPINCQLGSDDSHLRGKFSSDSEAVTFEFA